MKKLLIALSLSMVLLVGCGEKKEGDKTAEIYEKGTIVMGVDDTFAPMGFRDNNGNLVGFDVDLANELSKELGKKIDIQPIDWSMKETELNSGNIDLIWNGYSVTKAREEKVNFSDVYLENKQIIVTLDENIKSKADLKDKKVAVQNGSSTLDAINKEPEVVQGFSGGEPVLFDTNNEAFLDLESGRSDAVVADEVLAKYYIRQKNSDKYRVLDDNFGEEVYAIGMRKGDKQLLEDINKGLSSLRENGKYDEIYDKWFKD